MKTKFILLSIFILTTIFSSCSGDEKTLGVGDKVQHDDFIYTVEKVNNSNSIVNATASGIFYIIKFRVQNNAKKVDHEWKNDIAYIEDENGNIYENDINMQKRLDSLTGFGFKDNYLTKAGTSETTTLIFDIPAAVKQPYLKYRGDFLMGDLFDGNQFKRTRIKLF